MYYLINLFFSKQQNKVQIKKVDESLEFLEVYEVISKQLLKKELLL